MTQPTYITDAGLAKLKAELDMFRTAKRQEVASRIQRANAMGGTVDNAEYDEAKKEQAFVEGHILEIEAIINTAKVIEPKGTTSGMVSVGSTVTVRNHLRKRREQYFIVGSPETDPSSGKVSNVSPIGKALIGKKIGDSVEIHAPAGTIRLEILEIG